MKLGARMALGKLVLGLLVGVALIGCKSTGQGMGESTAGNTKATFTWEESGPTSGKLKATLTTPGGTQETYEGKFYQITTDTHVQTISDLWQPWYPGWYGWPLARKERMESCSMALSRSPIQRAWTTAGRRSFELMTIRHLREVFG